MSQFKDFQNPDDAKLTAILKNMKRIAVVGLSAKEDRASHGIARFLKGRDLEVIGVNPVLKEDVLGLEIVPTLPDIVGPVDLVDVFRKSEAVPAIVEASIACGAKCIWLQEGVIHEEAAARAQAAGIDVVMDLCIYKEWLRLLNG